jgi:saccharopine dehydrogenase-like NADP-dependent oxidoreductase
VIPAHGGGNAADRNRGEAMRIVILGGAGDVGSRAAEDLASTDGVAQVTIADRDLTRARRLSTRLAGRRARVDAVAVDAEDHGALVRTMRGYDAVASALGPFHRFERTLVRASLEAGTDYASVCDEWQAADAVLQEFDGWARAAGRTILTGLGTSPGLSNVAVRHLASQLRRPRRADISVLQPLDAGGGEAVLRHMLFIVSGSAPALRSGTRTLIPACTEERIVEFPRFGAVRTWNMGHSEPVTLPRFIPELEEVNFFMGFGRGAGLIVQPARWGVFRNRWCEDAVVALATRAERLFAGGGPAWGALRVDVWGEGDTANEHRLLCGVGQMREVTGIALAAGTLMLARKELTTRAGGVYAPEACLDPPAFIARLRAKGILGYADIEMREPIA